MNDLEEILGGEKVETISYRVLANALTKYKLEGVPEAVFSNAPQQSATSSLRSSLGECNLFDVVQFIAASLLYTPDCGKLKNSYAIR